MPKPEDAAGLAEQPRDVARAVVAHHPLDPDAARAEPAQRPHQEAGGRRPLLVWQHLDIGQPRGIIDHHMHHPPARAVRGAAAVAGDAMPDPLEAGQALGVEVQQFARALALEAHHRRAVLQGGQPPDPEPGQVACYRAAG
jgi:hypothetical protein